MKTILKPTLFLLLILLLAACGGSTGTTDNPVPDVAPTSDVASADDSSDTSAAPAQTGDKVRLSEDYADAAPASTQLIIGSLQLEETDQAIDGGRAAQILPLWQAYQALSNADTTADAELQAVVNQIQGVMNPEQIQAVAALQVTSESAQAIMQELGIGMGRRGFGGGGEDGADSGGFRPGGDLPGGGGGGGGGGLPGGFTDMSPEEREAAIAERFGGDNASAFLERGLLQALIRNLQVKTGEIDTEQAAPAGGFAGRFVDTIAEATGVDAETLQAALEKGKSYAEAINENGGDPEAAKDALRAFFAERGLEGDDLEQRVEGFLNGTN